jgi:hypothetical protein
MLYYRLGPDTRPSLNIPLSHAHERPVVPCDARFIGVHVEPPSGTGHSFSLQQSPILCQMAEPEAPPMPAAPDQCRSDCITFPQTLASHQTPVTIFCLRSTHHSRESSISGRPYRHHSRPTRPGPVLVPILSHTEAPQGPLCPRTTAGNSHHQPSCAPSRYHITNSLFHILCRREHFGISHSYHLLVLNSLSLCL